jgi:anthranilate/para-aminobenzoate synthase component I
MLNILPAKSTFIENVNTGDIYPIYAEMPCISPRLAYESIGNSNSFLFESIKGPDKIARYSFIGADPFLVFKVKNGIVEIEYLKEHDHSLKKDKKKQITPLKKLKALLTAYKVMSSVDLPPFTGGAAGIISYDFVHYFEKLPRTTIDDLDIPDAHFMFVDTVIAIDHELQKTFLISCPGAEEIISGSENSWHHWDRHYDNACRKINTLFSKLKSIPYSTVHSDSNNLIDTSVASGEGRINIHHEMDKHQYIDIVRKTKRYIKAGDIFQANLSQRVSAKIGNINPWQIYSILSQINPSPFAAYLDMGDYHIASSSPERLVKVSGNTVETRPIAGTRPRGSDADDDRLMRNELLLNEKERAEHLMLIDLERNDLGKISDYSSVEVDELMITEDCSHVIHIVSNIRGTIAKGKDCFDAIRATFPGGTITGVPKVRCMEIIDELEPVVRGPYTGSVGYISFSGDMDLNIIIRTFVIKDKTAYVQAGAGIVADSDPEKEYYETLKKAEALIRTLEVL